MAASSVENATETNSSFAKIKDAVQEISDMSAYIATAAEEQNQMTDEVAMNTESIKVLLKTSLEMLKMERVNLST